MQQGLTVARGLREAIVKTSPPCSRNLGPDAVERSAILLVLIEPLIHHVPEKTAGLGYTEAESAFYLTLRAVGKNRSSAISEKRGHISHRREPKAHGDRSGCAIDGLVDQAWLAATFDFYGILIREVPFRTRNLAAGSTGRRPDI